MGYQRVLSEISQDFHVSLPLTEQDIIELHSMCMLEGFHAITVPNLEAGRSMMQTLLASLDFYHAVAALSIQGDEPLPTSVADLFQLLEGNQRAKLADIDILESFFLEHFNYDFLWVEACPELLRMPWYLAIQQTIQKFNIHNEIPIFIISYEG